MPKFILYSIILIETIALIVFGLMLIQDSKETDKTTAIEPIGLSSRAMTVYVKSVGKGDSASDVVGKVYAQDDITGRSEFLFDLGAGCFPTWTVNPQDGYNLLVADDADVTTESLESLMRAGDLRYEFQANGELQITKTMGIRASTLNYDDHSLSLNQRCS